MRSEKAEQPGAILWQGRHPRALRNPCRHSSTTVQLVHHKDDCDVLNKMK